MARYNIPQNPIENFDLEDLRRLIPRLIAIVCALAVAVGVFTSFYTVEPDGKVVIKRFGKVVAIQDPGLHFKLPFWIDKHYFVPTERVLKEEFGFETIEPGQRSQFATQTAEHRRESLMLTGDLNVIDVQWVVQYRVSDPDKFLHHLRNQRETIRVISEVVMRRIVGNRLSSDALTLGRIEIASMAQEEMQKIVDTYDMGIRISTIELKDVTPPDPVKPAFNEVNEARQQQQRMINDAEKIRNQTVPRARGEALKIIAQAKGYEAERINRAKGQSARFLAIYDEYRQAPQITRRRLYLEMVDQVMPNIGSVYVVEPGQGTPIPLLYLGGTAPRQKAGK